MFNTSEEIFYLVIVGVALMIFFALIFILSIIRYQNRMHKHIQEQNRREKEFTQTLLQTQLEIQEQTLQHISHELHDNLGQVASLIKINLNTLQLGDTAKAAEKIENTKELARQLIGDLKALSVSLGADRIAQSGLAKALETEVERLNKTGQFNASFTQQGNPPVLDKDKAVILYRMAQEVLNNMVKHSGAKQIAVSLNASENLFTLAFSDDGVGFNITDSMNSGGAGLNNLHNRARLINAQLHLQSTPANGTLVTIVLPL